MSDSQFIPEKTVFTEADFEEMSWHDNVIHAFARNVENFRLFLDIDHIVKWEEADARGAINVWKSPTTLIFFEVSGIQIHIDHSGSVNIPIEILELHRKPGLIMGWEWNFECLMGHISFKAMGFKQYLRQLPIFTGSPDFGSYLEERRYSFETPEKIT